MGFLTWWNPKIVIISGPQSGWWDFAYRNTNRSWHVEGNCNVYRFGWIQWQWRGAFPVQFAGHRYGAYIFGRQYISVSLPCGAALTPLYLANQWFNPSHSDTIRQWAFQQRRSGWSWAWSRSFIFSRHRTIWKLDSMNTDMAHVYKPCVSCHSSLGDIGTRYECSSWRCHSEIRVLATGPVKYAGWSCHRARADKRSGCTS